MRVELRLRSYTLLLTESLHKTFARSSQLESAGVKAKSTSLRSDWFFFSRRAAARRGVCRALRTAHVMEEASASSRTLGEFWKNLDEVSGISHNHLRYRHFPAFRPS